MFNNPELIKLLLTNIENLYFRTIFNVEFNDTTAIFRTCGFISHDVGCGSYTVACVFMQNNHSINYGRLFEKVFGKCFLQTQLAIKGKELFADNAETKKEDLASTQNFTLSSTGGDICQKGLRYKMFLYFRCYNGMEVGNVCKN